MGGRLAQEGRTTAVQTFSATNDSTAVVAADRAAIWAALTDPDTLVSLTPLLERIDVDGDLWLWKMGGISAMGVTVAPSFTERMTFEEGRRIEYVHEPPAGKRERAGAHGVYELEAVSGGTLLHVRITLCVELPLPGLARGAVQKIMATTMQKTGDRFATNLLAHLKLQPTPAAMPTKQPRQPA